MDALAEAFVASLLRRKPEPALLETAGDEDPPRSAMAFLAALDDPALARSAGFWVPALLRSARPGFGARCLAELAALARRGGAPLDPERCPWLPAVVGSSSVLARVLHRHPEWLEDLAGDVPPAPSDQPLQADWTVVRRAKYRGLLRIAARDLAGRAFEAGLRELSDLADRCLVAGLACAAEETGLAAPALFALGKLGGRELNFSSDVDLLFLYTPTPDRDELEQNQNAGAVIRHFKRQLETPTTDGFGYRVDLDLRPEGRTGVLANSVDAALAYYETFGAEWERQMLIRLRGVAGCAATREAFCQAITPFVYRRLIDPGVMTAVRAMKNRIESERRSAGRDLEADIKEGPGGIRDVEFIVQSLQLFFGGRHPELRTGNVLDTLAALQDLELLPEAITASLSSAYLWLRRVEHCLQLPEERQTARFPRDIPSQIGLARRLGYAQSEGDRARDSLLDDWSTVRTEVRAHFDALVLSGEP